MAEAVPILAVENLHLSLGSTEILRGVDIDVPGTGITALIGSNGAGKTVLLNAISGIYHPEQGRILFEGEPIQGCAAHIVARKGLGRTFQHLELFPRLTVTENLLVARDTAYRASSISTLWFRGATRKQEMAQYEFIEDVIDFFELWNVRHVIAKALPYGVQKVVGLARAMATGPKILLLDEPASGLTRDEKENLARFLLRLRHDRNVPILWIEHDLDLILDLADYVHALELGRCIASGTPEVVRNHPAVVESYLGGSKCAA